MKKSSQARSTGSEAGMVTGSASMMSCAVTPSRRVANVLAATAWRPPPAEDPAEDEVPDRARPVGVAEPLVGAVADQQHGERLTEEGGDAGRAVAVTGEAPDRGTGDPAAVERERGDQVEHEQDHVHRDREADDH